MLGTERSEVRRGPDGSVDWGWGVGVGGGGVGVGGGGVGGGGSILITAQC